MRRSIFLQSTGLAALAAATPLRTLAQAVGSTTTQQAILRALPAPKPGEWVRLILGTGVAYQKQIGIGVDAESGDRDYYETQVGIPGGSCNPNTMQRAYLKDDSFGSLLTPQPVLAYVADSGTTLTRWNDVDGGQPAGKTDKDVRLLDVRYLYDDRPMRIVSSEKTMLELPAPIAYAGSEDASRGKLSPHETTHVVADFVAPTDATHTLKRVEMWTTPAIPFGLAKYRAIPADAEPFDMHVFSYGTHFKTALAMSLRTIRGLTPNGTYVNAG